LTPLYLPATLAELMYLGKPTRPATTVLQLPLRYGWLNPSSAQLPPEVGTVVTFVSGQADWALARSALRSWHLHQIYDLKPYGDLGYIGSSHQESQGQSITFPHQVDSAAFALP